MRSSPRWAALPHGRHRAIALDPAPRSVLTQELQGSKTRSQVPEQAWRKNSKPQEKALQRCISQDPRDSKGLGKAAQAVGATEASIPGFRGAGANMWPDPWSDRRCKPPLGRA